MFTPTPYGWISQYFIGFSLLTACICHFGHSGLKTKAFQRPT